jgi:hypothetical protein
MREKNTTIHELLVKQNRRIYMSTRKYKHEYFITSKAYDPPLVVWVKCDTSCQVSWNPVCSLCSWAFSMFHFTMYSFSNFFSLYGAYEQTLMNAKRTGRCAKTGSAGTWQAASSAFATPDTRCLRMERFVSTTTSVIYLDNARTAVASIPRAVSLVFATRASALPTASAALVSDVKEYSTLYTITQNISVQMYILLTDKYNWDFFLELFIVSFIFIYFFMILRRILTKNQMI